ncbi:unnamed protein product [Blepharisma stoltei]|uniref:Uncharacterized protein n=1 Tax=Blepharisma stoltei TaxID=1481888 RepID=A0AAU9IER9_9CILI|nr:unnamed protein product [Blepharisma stoltei]
MENPLRQRHKNVARMHSCQLDSSSFLNISDINPKELLKKSKNDISLYKSYNSSQRDEFKTTQIPSTIRFGPNKLSMRSRSHSTKRSTKSDLVNSISVKKENLPSISKINNNSRLHPAFGTGRLSLNNKNNQNSRFAAQYSDKKWEPIELDSSIFKPKRFALLDMKNVFNSLPNGIEKVMVHEKIKRTQSEIEDSSVIKLKPLPNEYHSENYSFESRAFLPTFEGSPGESESPSPTYQPRYIGE